MSESAIKESSIIHSNANLGVHGQGLLNLSGPGDCIEAQRLVLLLFYSIHICRVEDILVEGCIAGSVVHFHRARTITIDSLGTISASGMVNIQA
ncbi:hypothetical protein LOK49_LG02G02188 [Camellia lanceoleosa]|uniref:Uncharacterized protein n=1 Tax=Camellia lanceoleosa TaxID=1840588 RepID=A0ACC0IL95_9ERIC|nr:hypothetical protein LOK49_LG02G02188 [Camellia lanceoleosa]